MAENTVQENLDAFYLQRIQVLKTLQLEDLMMVDVCHYPLLENNSAPDIVAHLIEAFLASQETDWRILTSNPQFCRDVILLTNGSGAGSFEYERELAKAQNRLALKFIDKFCTPSYRVDWQKILQDAGTTTK